MGGDGAWSVEGAALEHIGLIGVVRDEEGLAGCSPCLTTWGVLSLAGKAVGLRGERSQSEKVPSQNPVHPSTLPASCSHMHYAVRFIHTALFLVGFIFPTLQMKKLKDRTKSLVESDSPCLWTWSTRATAGRSAPVTSPVPFLLISFI